MDVIGKGGVRIFFSVPNIFTLLNIAFGFLGLYFCILEDFKLAFLCIFLAIVSDGLDGFIARKLNAVSDFGRELDSLCDMVSFGVTPAVMFLMSMGNGVPIVLSLFVAIIYVAFGSLRLARFNIYGSKEFFEGLAIPAAAFFECLVVICIAPLSPFASIVLTMVTAILMISTIRFPSMKTREGVRAIGVAILVGIAYFIAFSLYIPGIMESIEAIAYWIMFSIMMSYITTSPMIFGLLGG